MHSFPEFGTSYEEISEQLDELSNAMTPEKSGKFASTAFWGIESANQLVHETYEKFINWNALFSFQEPSAAKFENDVLDICTGLAGGGESGRANLTTGGTESNFCGLFAMRSWAREHHPHIATPEIIAPYSIHSTVHKMARVLDLRIKTVPQLDDLSADVALLPHHGSSLEPGMEDVVKSWKQVIISARKTFVKPGRLKKLERDDRPRSGHSQIHNRPRNLLPTELRHIFHILHIFHIFPAALNNCGKGYALANLCGVRAENPNGGLRASRNVCNEAY